MADVQLEKGFLRVANDLMDALAKIRIPGEAWQVLAVIIRQTYGWNKETDHIPLSRFAEMTGLWVRSVRRAIENLLAMRVVVRSSTPKGYLYSINKDHDLWKQPSAGGEGAPKGAVRNNAHGECAIVRTEGCAKTRNSKDIYKDNIKDRAQAFVDLFHERCPSLPRVQILTDKRIRHINARLKEHPDMDWWAALFRNEIEASDFLTGKVPPRETGRKPFKADIDWIVNPNNLAKIIEGKYRNAGGKMTLRKEDCY